VPTENELYLFLNDCILLITRVSGEITYCSMHNVVQNLIYTQVHKSFTIYCFASARLNSQGIVFMKNKL
jgi:hypothetical protein